MFTKLFWKDAAERAIATFAQTIIAIIAVLAPTSDLTLMQINYLPVLAVGGVAAALSVLKSLAAARKAGTDTASLVVDSKELN